MPQTHDARNSKIYIKMGSVTVVLCTTSETEAKGKSVTTKSLGAS